MIVTADEEENSLKNDKEKWIVASLKRYEWLSKNCLKLCHVFKVSCEDVFALELKVSTDMTQLLPSKIDRIHYLNEKSFSL